MKKRIIKYMENESDFTGSFEKIKDKIHTQNIVIREKENKSFKLFRNKKFKIAFASALVLGTVVSVKGLKDIHDFFYINNFDVVQKSFVYDNYEEFKENYNYYQSFSNEAEKKIFEVKLNEENNYLYYLNVSVKCDLGNRILSAGSINLYMKINYKNTSSLFYIEYYDKFSNYNDVNWLLNRDNFYYLWSNEYNENVLAFKCQNFSSDQITYIQSYLIEQIQK